MSKEPAEMSEDEIRLAREFEKKEAAFLEEREKLKKVFLIINMYFEYDNLLLRSWRESSRSFKHLLNNRCKVLMTVL